MSRNKPAEPQFVRLCECGCGQPPLVRMHNAKSAGRIKGQPARFVATHGPNAKVRYEVGPEMWTVEPSGCWRGNRKPTSEGYCEVKLAGVSRKLHVAVYEHLVGPVPAGLQLDHLCRNRACCNPAHLEPVTLTENVRRGLRAKLSMEKAEEIRSSDERTVVLAAHYGVSIATIDKVRAGTAWRPEARGPLNTPPVKVPSPREPVA